MRGVGYYVRDLKRHIRQILGLDRKLRVAIIGAGNLGLALADYPGFRQEGFEIAALFDALQDKVGQLSRSGVLIHDIQNLKRVAKKGIDSHRGDRGAGRVGAAGARTGRRRRHQGRAEFFSRHD